MRRIMKTSLLYQIVNIICACLSSLLIWCLTDRDFMATIIITLVILLTIIAMLAHYVSRQYIIREELENKVR